MTSKSDTPNIRNTNEQPPDFKSFINESLNNLKLSPANGRFSVIITMLLALTAFSVWTAYYTVASDSVAVVQRFGKYLKIVPAGLHFKIPFGIDTATIVPVKRQLKQEFGFSTPGANDPHQSPEIRDEKKETQMVTGDLNAALVEWVVQYRISDPAKFLFEVKQPKKHYDMFQNLLCAKLLATAQWMKLLLSVVKILKLMPY